MESAHIQLGWELHIDNISSDEYSSISSDEDSKKKTKFPSHEKISTEKTERSKETARDSNVSSQKKKQEKKKSAVKKKCQAKINSNDLKIAQELSYINFPLDADYDFRLVCSWCLIKEKEGVNAFHLKDVCTGCAMDRLAIKKKSKSSWLLIRDRPFHTVFSMCLDFKRCVPCKENPCTFAHGEGECRIWTYELEKKFKLDTFIKVLRKNNVVTSLELAEAKSKTTYIPGLSTISSSKPIVQPFLDSTPTNKFAGLTPLPDLVIETLGNEPNLKLHHPDDSVVAPQKGEPSNPSLKPVSVESWPLTNENPLKSTHDFRMFCSECYPGTCSTALPHTNCLRNVLAFSEKGDSNWLHVRERKKLDTFSRYYVLCRSLTDDRSLCTSGPKHCPFAHNNIELLLWNADRSEKFDLTRFFYSQFSDKYRILHFATKYGTSFSYICGACFRSSELIINQSKNGNFCDSLSAHNWNSYKTLFYAPDRKLIHKVLNLCLYRECFERSCKLTCSMAHSTVEREVWILLHAANITEEKFMEEMEIYSHRAVGKKGICPYELLPLCERCYIKYPSTPGKRCDYWRKSCIVIYVTIPEMKRIRNLPTTIRKNDRLTICSSLKDSKCQYEHKCTSAHSQEELDVWKWMIINEIKELENIVLDQEKLSTAPLPATEIPASCAVCSMYCDCSAREHYKRVTNDQEQQWNYRKPPFSCKIKKSFQLCQKHDIRHGLDMYNWCPNAHGINEYKEWKKRFQLCSLKTHLGKKSHIMAYIVELQKTYLNSPKPFNVMRDNIPDVQVEVIGENYIFSVDEKFSWTWTITVISRTKELQKVSLLHDKDRLYFTLKTDFNQSNSQVLDAHLCKMEGEINHWKVTVSFYANMYGSFSQRVIFDFGDKPLLFQDLKVELGKYHELQQLLTICDEINFVLWTPENREIIFLEEKTDLMKKYKRPVNIENILSHDVITTSLNRYNYVQKMHKLLYLEEFACQQKMARYNLCADMFVSDTMSTGSIFIGIPGTFFGELPLPEELSEDTDIGRMILNSCTYVYIGLPTHNSKIYEVEIVKDDGINFKGQRRNTIYLSLMKSCTEALGLVCGAENCVEVQFQLNRQSFCLMHFALDNIQSTDIVFPDPAKNVSSSKTKCSSKFLNKEQLIAVKHIIGERKNFLCPFILNGAYGTGKTETLTQATMHLLDTQVNAKILICTQCNSSADLFILKHLDKYMQKRGTPKMLLRMYYSGRRITSVPSEVLKYTLMSPKQDKFLIPESKDFYRYRVVICTLENCYELIKLGLKGHFTHIFVDEAAQEFEAKVLLPLSLASRNTRVVLSGDRHQMGVKIHSTEARRQGLGISIMQRLFDHYAKHPHQSDSPLHALLVRNYRSMKEITHFISECFYGIKIDRQKIMPAISSIKPLQFYAVYGVETYHDNSPSYFNEREALKVLHCIVNVESNWPDILGPFNPESVCVVSSYKEQVNQIRKTLRRHSTSLRQVTVDQVENLPGKEFDVIIISTVRTRRFFDISSENLANYCDETDEFGFFFNKKLLNTAMTRAKYSIIVVGDPVALIGYGKCSTIWRMFMARCTKLCSINPPEITYDYMRSELSDLLSIRERSIEQEASQLASFGVVTNLLI